MLDTLADFAGIARWSRMVDHSCLLTPEPVGTGTTRRVQVGRQTLVETIVEWDPPTSLSYRIEPFPGAIDSVVTTWTVAPGDGDTEVRVSTVATPKRSPGARVLTHVLVRVIDRTNRGLLADLIRHAERTGSRA